MEWHLSTAKPEWEGVKPGKRNRWQRLAVRTHGFVTPGNMTSFIGVALVFVGLVAIWYEAYWLSFMLLAVGRICDIADGLVAHRTRTKSPLGEAVDATCDKIGALATLVVYTAASFLWWPAALLIGAQNLLNSLIGLIGHQRRYELHPLPAGKVSTVGEWIALLGLGLLAAMGGEQTSPLGLAWYSVLGASLVLGAYATFGYFRLFWKESRRRGVTH